MSNVMMWISVNAANAARRKRGGPGCLVIIAAALLIGFILASCSVSKYGCQYSKGSSKFTGMPKAK